MEIVALHHEQIVLREASALGASASGTSAVFSMEKAEGFSVSSYAERGAADTDVDVDVQASFLEAGPFRTVAEFNLAVTAAAPTDTWDAVYSATRMHYRLHWLNNSANALAAFEVGVLRKALS